MASTKLREFLESSTIHGLVHISTAKSKTARAVWVAIVVACFAYAIYMINNSYEEWQESPVSTTITTHPITELEFPTVTVCPPRGSNTALNHLLEKVKDVNFTKEQGGITCEAIAEPRKSSYAINERVIINFRDKNVVIARFCDKNEVFVLFIDIYIYIYTDLIFVKTFT